MTAGWSVERLTADHELDHFDCSVDELSSWLKKHALQSDRSSDSRVFVAVHGDQPARVMGYYGLRTSSVVRDPGVLGLFKGAGGYETIGAVLLTRFGVDHTIQRQGLGTTLLKDMLERILDLAENVAFRVLVVDALNAAARDWYMKFDIGFQELPDDSLKLYLSMKQLRKAAAS